MPALEPQDYRAARLAARAATYASRVAHLRALRDQTAGELCGHGVAITNCLDHRMTTRTDAETTTTEEHESDD